jgi:radical SAM superfamily enzyme YgiQ (UPF0313 family)
VIRGEGEKPFVDFFRYLKGQRPIEGVPNLAYKRDGEFVFNPIGDNFPIDELALPDLSDSSVSRYDMAGKPMTFMITSRSCPHKCSFCSVHTTFGTDYRRRSLENVLEEIELRYQQGYRVIDFEDDNLTYYKNTFKQLCRRLIAANRGMEFRHERHQLLESRRRIVGADVSSWILSSEPGPGQLRQERAGNDQTATYLRVLHKSCAQGPPARV